MKTFEEIFGEEMKREVRDNVLVINNEISFKLLDEEVESVVKALTKMGLTPERVKGVSAPKAIEEEDNIQRESKSSKKSNKSKDEEPKRNFTPTENYAIAMQREDNLLSSDLVCVSKEGKEYRARFNYNFITSVICKGDKEKAEWMKEKVFKPEIKEFGATWVGNDNDKIDFGWYKFPNKAKAEGYAKVRLAKDKEYDDKKAGKSKVAAPAPVITDDILKAALLKLIQE